MPKELPNIPGTHGRPKEVIHDTRAASYPISVVRITGEVDLTPICIVVPPISRTVQNYSTIPHSTVSAQLSFTQENGAGNTANPGIEHTMDNPYDKKDVPPLGQIPNIDKLATERILEMPYAEITQFPELARDYSEMARALNERRRDFGLSPVDFNTSTVRLIAPDLYDRDDELTRLGKNGAFYHPANGAIFIRFDKQDYAKSRLERINYVYILMHEAVHKGMDGKGIQEYSLDLNEGIVDNTAREILEERILSQYLEAKDFEERKEYITQDAQYVEGVSLLPEDIILTEQGKLPIAYTRILQMFVLRQIKHARPDIYESLIEQAFAGKPKEARTSMEQAFGQEIANSAASVGTSLKELGDSILAYGLIASE